MTLKELKNRFFYKMSGIPIGDDPIRRVRRLQPQQNYRQKSIAAATTTTTTTTTTASATTTATTTTVKVAV